MNAGRRLLGWSNLLLASLLMFVVWLLLVWVSSRPGLRKVWDLSPGQRYTVSPVTEELLAEVRQAGIEVEFHTFLQPLGQSPPRDPMTRQRWQIASRLQELTVDLLQRYSELGSTAVRVKHHNIYLPSEDTSSVSLRFGVRNDAGDTVVVAVKGRHKRLSLEGDLAFIEYPAMQPATGMPTSELPILKDYKGEEALSSAVKSLLVQGTPVLYFLGGHEEADRQSTTLGASYGLLVQGLEQEGFECRELDLRRGGAVPDLADLVVILEPRIEFTEREAGAIHSYLRRGGRVFLNYSFIQPGDRNPTGGELGQLLGFEVGREAVFHLIPDRNPGAPGLDGSPGVARLDVGGNPNHPITKPLTLARRSLQLQVAREVRRRSDAPEGTRYDELLRTGPYAWLAATGPDGHPSFRGPRQEGGYRERAIGAVIDIDGEQQGITGHLVIISGIGFSNPGMAVHGDLVLNIANWLVERKELVTVRGRRYQATHLDLSPQQLSRIWYFLVVAVPALLLALGIGVKWRRSRL